MLIIFHLLKFVLMGKACWTPFLPPTLFLWAQGHSLPGHIPGSRVSRPLEMRSHLCSQHAAREEEVRDGGEHQAGGGDEQPQPPSPDPSLVPRRQLHCHGKHRDTLRAPKGQIPTQTLVGNEEPLRARPKGLALAAERWRWELWLCLSCVFPGQDPVLSLMPAALTLPGDSRMALVSMAAPADGTGSALALSQPVRQRLQGPSSIPCLENTGLLSRDSHWERLLSWQKLLSHCSLGAFLLAGPCAGSSSCFPSAPKCGRLLRKKEQELRAALALLAHPLAGPGDAHGSSDIAWPCLGCGSRAGASSGGSSVPGCDRRGAHTPGNNHPTSPNSTTPLWGLDITMEPPGRGC